MWRSQQSRNNGAAARKTQASRRAPARPRFLEPFTKPLGWGFSPPSQAVARQRQGSGPQVEQETALGQTSWDHLVQPQVREMALAKLPRRRRTLSEGPGARPGRRLLHVAEPLGGNSGRFKSKPQAQAAQGGRRGPGQPCLSTSTHPPRA